MAIIFATAEDSILAGLQWFARIGIPATISDLYRFCWRHSGAKVSLAELDAAVTMLVIRGSVQRRNNYYALANSDVDSFARMNKAIFMEKKMDLAKRFAKIARFIPGIRGIFVCNDGGIFQSKIKSDTDLFIVARKGTVWLVRLLTVLAVFLSGNKRVSETAENPLCLSFYVTDDGLDLKDIALKPVDPYLAYWIMALYPLLDDGCYEEIIRINRAFVEKYFQNFFPVRPHLRWQVKSSILSRLPVLAWLENFVRDFQIKKLPFSYSEKRDENPGTIVTDNMLKFHLEDMRKKYADDWREAINTRGIFYTLE